MIKYFALIAIVCLCSTSGVVSDLPDASPPTQYTITHEAVFDVIIKENAQATEILKQGQFVVGLFGNIVPMTVLNFVTITNGLSRNNVRGILE